MLFEKRREPLKRFPSSAYGIRTRVPGVRGRYPRPLDESAMRLDNWTIYNWTIDDLPIDLFGGSWGIRTPGTVTRTSV